MIIKFAIIYFLFLSVAIMPYCGVAGCKSGGKNQKEKDKVFKFYFLPKSESMRKLWLQKMNRDFTNSMAILVVEFLSGLYTFRYK